MKPRQLLFPAILAAAIGALWLSVHLNQTRHSAAPENLVATDATVADSITDILAERDDVRRLRLLAAWVDAHTLEEIGSALARVHEDDRRVVQELVALKLRDLAATLSREELINQEWLYISGLSGNSSAPPSPVESLLALAATDPAAAFNKARDTRMIPEDRERVMCESLGRLAARNPRQALALLSETRSVNQRKARRLIAENWAAADPRAALDWALTQGASPAQRLTDDVLILWSKKDPAAAVEAAAALPVGIVNDSVTTELLNRWFGSSPGESLEWINAQPNPGPLILKAAVAALANTHPAEAAALLGKPMPARALFDCTRTLVAMWAISDPIAASRWLQSRPMDRTNLAAATTLVGPLAKKDPATAFAFYRTLPTDANLGEITRNLADGLSGQAAFDWLVTLPPSSATTAALADAARRMNFVEPAEYLSLLGRAAPGPQQDAIYIAATRRQLESNPAGTAEWLRNLPNPATRDSVLSAIVADWTYKSPSTAAAYAQTLPAGPVLDEFTVRLVLTWHSRDPAAAADWTLTLPDSRGAREGIQRAFSSLAQQLPQDALQRLDQIPPGTARTAALSGLIGGLSSTRPDEAARIIATLDSSAEQAASAGTLAYRWGGSEPAAASAWVKNLPAGEVRDQGLANLSGALARNDPEAPLALLPLANSDEARYRIARSSLLALQERDERSARSALARLTLAPATLARLKETLDDHAER